MRTKLWRICVKVWYGSAILCRAKPRVVRLNDGMNAKRISVALLILAAAGLATNQWRLQRAINDLSGSARSG